MYRIIKIGDKEVPMKATSATDIFYRQVFHQDLMKTLLPVMRDQQDPEKLIDVIPVINGLAYIMNAAAEGKAGTASPDGFVSWLDQFEPGAVSNAALDILNLYIGNTETTVEPKKENGPETEN